VRFVGYSADVIARKGNTTYANLDFVGGMVGLFADEGWLSVPKRSDLAAFVSDLPSRIDKLKASVNSATPPNDRDCVEAHCGESEIRLDRRADIDGFVRQMTQRYRQIEPILEQAEKVGSGINRPPYCDYIDEIARTGISRVVFYGDALFVDGKLLFRPERQTLLVKPTEDERTFLITPASIS
jgi:hypothetical protein